MRICLLTSTFLPKLGGAELCVDYLAREFHSAGHDVVVVAPVSDSPNSVIDRPYPIYRYQKPFSQYGWYGAAKRLLIRLQREKPFDLVNAHMTYPAGYLGRWMAVRFGIPLVITPHGGGLFYRSRFRRRRWIWSRIINALEQADGVIALSGYFETLLREAAPGQRQIVRIGNGVDNSEYAAIESAFTGPLAFLNGCHYVMGIGRLVGRKGFDTAIKGFARVAADYPELHLVLAGDGPKRDELEALARQSGGGERIHFVGAQTGRIKVALLQRAQLVIIPSVEEDNMPLVVLEAMAAGRPVLASRLGGIPDVVVDGENGRLFEPGNDQELATGLGEMMQQGKKLERMAHLARQTADNLDWSVISKQYLQMFQQITQQNT